MNKTQLHGGNQGCRIFTLYYGSGNAKISFWNTVIPFTNRETDTSRPFIRKTGLGRKQFEISLKGNVTILIFPGKNLLGQADRVESKTETEVKGGFDKFSEILRSKKLGTADNVEGVVAPVGMLGAANGMIAAEALHLSDGKLVRIFPHIDGVGRDAVKRWTRQRHDAEAQVEAFDLTVLVCADGQPGKDLNGLCRIDADCYEQNRKFWKEMP